MTITIETYLNSLSNDILSIDISGKGINFLPDLTRFVNLKILDCSHNNLNCLPTLPQNLEVLYCSRNKLTFLPILPQNLKILYCFHNNLNCLPTLPQNLEVLYCSHNKLTSLYTLPQNLEVLYCSHNKLTSLPTLPQNLIVLHCYDTKLTSLPTLPQNLEKLVCSINELTYFPTLPENLEELYFFNNPIYEIVKNNSLIEIKQNIQILNNFRHLYYCLQYKKQLRKWLWEKVREPSIKKIFHPNYFENLGNEDDLDIFLTNWICKTAILET